MLSGFPAVHIKSDRCGDFFEVGAIDSSAGFYRGHADKSARSLMKVTFNLPAEDFEKQFTSEAITQDWDGLKGHRSVGGIRASIYNAFPKEGVEALVEFMRDFSEKNG